MDSNESKRIYAIRLDKPEYGSDINRNFCLHILAQYRKFEPELSSEDGVVRANTLLILITRTLNMMNKPFWGCTGYPSCKGAVSIK
jgi:hypothetical protein